MIPRIRLETGLFDSLKAILPLPNPQKKLASELLNFFNAKQVLLFASGRSALYHLLKALPQKKVFIPAYTCAVVKEAVLLAGKQCIELDIGLETFSFGPKELAKKIKKNSIVLATHQFGIPCEIEKIAELCKKNNCILIEDNAAALGTKINGKLTGTFGQASILSFDYTKTLACARGGAVIFNDTELFKKTRETIPKNPKSGFSADLKRFFYVSLYNFFASPKIYGLFTLPLLTKNSLFADKGQISKEKNQEYAAEMSTFQARLGLSQFKRLSETIAKRKAIAGFFQKALEKSRLKIPNKNLLKESVLIRFPIIVPTKNKIVFYNACRKKGLDLGFSFSYSLKGLPNANIAAQKVLDLPFYSSLSRKEREKIVSIVKNVSENSETLELIALATRQQKLQKILFLLEESRKGRVVGAIGIVRRFGLPFLFLAVDPAFQGRGIGSRLMKKFLEKIPKKYGFIFLSQNTKIAEHIYLKAGFRFIGEKKCSKFMVLERRNGPITGFFVAIASFFLKPGIKG